MNKINLKWQIIAITLTMLPAAAVPASVIVVGPPTYKTSSTLVEDRGIFVESHRASSASRSEYKVIGAKSAGIQSFPEGGGTLPSGAIGIASDTQLKSLSRAAGRLAVPNPHPPIVEARNVSTTTRFFEFSSAQGSVPLDFFASVDGVLTSAYLAELIVDVHSSVRFGLDVVDLGNTVLSPVFEFFAVNEHTGPGTFSISATATGAANQADWQAAIADLGPPPGATPAGGRAFEVDYGKLLKNAYQAPTGQVLGFRWSLETEATVSGGFDFGTVALVESDFYNTANLDFALSDNAPTDASFVEILVQPPAATLPLPATGPLLLAAFGALVGIRRRNLGAVDV